MNSLDDIAFSLGSLLDWLRSVFYEIGDHFFRAGVRFATGGEGGQCCFRVLERKENQSLDSIYEG